MLCVVVVLFCVVVAICEFGGMLWVVGVGSVCGCVAFMLVVGVFCCVGWCVDVVFGDDALCFFVLLSVGGSGVRLGELFCGGIGFCVGWRLFLPPLYPR